MKPGKYIATVADAGIKYNYDDSQLIPFIVFRTEDGSQITWEGNLKTEKSKDYAVKTLYACGFIGLGWEDVAVGITKFAPQPVSIEVEEQVSKSGKKFAKVKWINGLKTVKRVTSTEVKAKMQTDSAFTKYAPKKKEDAGF